LILFAAIAVMITSFITLSKFKGVDIKWKIFGVADSQREWTDL
jgi:hypothetical protein